MIFIENENLLEKKRCFGANFLDFMYCNMFLNIKKQSLGGERLLFRVIRNFRCAGLTERNALRFLNAKKFESEI